MAKPNNLSQSIDVAGSLIRVDNLTLTDELDGVGTPVGSSGNSATITVGLDVNISGVSGMTSASAGNYIQITGASNSGNNGVFLIVDVLSATSVVILNDNAVNEGSGFLWTERSFYSLQSDLNYARTDRSEIKGVPYFQSVPSYFRTTNQAVPVSTNLLNVAGKLTDAKAVIENRIFLNVAVNASDTSVLLTDIGNLKHADAVNLTGVPVFDGFDAGNYDATFVEIVDGYQESLYVLSGLETGNRVFGRTIAAGSVSPNSVTVEFRSVALNEPIANSVPYSWEIGQANEVILYYGYRQSLDSLDENALRVTMATGLIGDASLKLRVDNLQQVVGVIDGDINLNGILTNTGIYYPFSELSGSSTVVDALNILNQEIGNRNYTGGVLTDGYTVTESIQQLYDSFISSSIALSNTAPINVTKSAASAGVGLTASRTDHKHDISTASAVGLTGASTNTEGVATTIARSDHTHSLTLDTDDISNVSTVPGITLTNALNNVVVGPISSTDNAIVRWDGITGKLVKDSNVTINAGIVDFNSNAITEIEYIDLNLLDTPDFPTHSEGRIFYDENDHTLAVMPDITDVILQVGQENYIRVINKTGATINDGSAVYIDGVQGNRPTITLAIANIEVTAIAVGVATHNILNNQEGFVTVFGQVRGFNTTAFSAGDILYLSPTIAGGLTNVKPTGTDIVWQIGTVLSSTVNGSIFVNVEGPSKIADLHDVNIDGPTDGYYLRGDGTYWNSSDFDADVTTVINGTSITGDVSGTIPNLNVVDLTITGEEQGSILYYNGTNWVQLPPSDDGYVLTTHDTGANPTWELSSSSSPRISTVEFALDEDISNTQVYFFAWRGAGNDVPGNKRSGSGTGISVPGTCSPYQSTFNGTIIKAILTVKGVGVQNGTVTYPVSFQTDLFEQGFSAESKIADIDFSISSSYTVGTFSPGNTDFIGSTDLNISVTEGQMLGLKFINGSGASLAGQLRNAFVTLIIESN